MLRAEHVDPRMKPGVPRSPAHGDDGTGLDATDIPYGDTGFACSNAPAYDDC
jgi:hypothetical protein